MSVGILTLTCYLPGCRSLKSKRSTIKPIIARLRKEFNVSVAEVDHHDVWQTAAFLIVCAANQGAHAEKTLISVLAFFESHWPDLPITQDNIEIMV